MTNITLAELADLVAQGSIDLQAADAIEDTILDAIALAEDEECPDDGTCGNHCPTCDEHDRADFCDHTPARLATW